MGNLVSESPVVKNPQQTQTQRNPTSARRRRPLNNNGVNNASPNAVITSAPSQMPHRTIDPSSSDFHPFPESILSNMVNHKSNRNLPMENQNPGGICPYPRLENPNLQKSNMPAPPSYEEVYNRNIIQPRPSYAIEPNQRSNLNNSGGPSLNVQPSAPPLNVQHSVTPSNVQYPAPPSNVQHSVTTSNVQLSVPPSNVQHLVPPSNAQYPLPYLPRPPTRPETIINTGNIAPIRQRRQRQRESYIMIDEYSDDPSDYESDYDQRKMYMGYYSKIDYYDKDQDYIYYKTKDGYRYKCYRR